MKKLFFLFLTFSTVVFSQDFSMFPTGMNIQPFSANILEPRVGFMFKSSGNELRLDIGNSIDLAKYQVEAQSFSLGADFFTWTLLRQESNFHFPVDAVDYLFGINLGYKNTIDNKSFGARFRLSHISAHLVDGHYDKKNLKWINNQLPRVYSREFIELIPFYEFQFLRLYAGLTYLFHTDPIVNNKLIYQLGFDYYQNHFMIEEISPFVAADFKFDNNGFVVTNQSYYLGIKFGKPKGKGIRLYFTHYDGMNIHGEYYDFKEKYSGFGMNIDF